MANDDPGMIWHDAQEQLEALRAQKLQRALQPASGRVGPKVIRGGRELWNFSSNNYLDLASHPYVVARAQAALEEFGAGAGGSRLITGTLTLHEELEAKLATLKGTESALIFSSGYLANLATVQVLSRRSDGSRVPIVFDKLVHASLVDAIMACGAPWKSFRHNDVEAARREAERLVAQAPAERGHSPRVLIVTEGVFSMDGDAAPLGELYEVAEQWDGLLVVDDAHGTGVVGRGGEGLVSAVGLAGAPRLVQIGTLSKALGSQGGFLAGPRLLRELVVNRGRGFIFDTALAPPCAAAALAALEILEREPERLEALRANARLLRSELQAEGIKTPEGPAAIIPVIVGSAERALALASQLAEKGFWGVAIRPPSVPPGTSRIRLTVMTTHPPEVVTLLARTVADLIRACSSTAPPSGAGDETRS